MDLAKKGGLHIWKYLRLLIIGDLGDSSLILNRKVWGRHVLHKETEMASRYVTVFSGPAMVHQLVLAEVGVVAAGYGALVGLYPCVSPHVVISVTDHRKSFRAKFA